ncbi:hypothetical protein CEXT_520581 [Caerostris extrusa]|uniref:Uncharacterized protein n=1 Tax=Caerostris extrusa TaxID=172846 RepID=A0AAV4T826_CAEEX|nr:hypothetical protein CEXT_520581 [Caerostris extrusa]
MASFAKHLSTHLYFHMERNHHKSGSRNSQPSASGFSRSSEVHYSPTTPTSWNKEHCRGNQEVTVTMVANLYRLMMMHLEDLQDM